MKQSIAAWMLVLFQLGLILLGIVLIIQLLKKILGGSWIIEELVLAAMMIIGGATFKNTIAIARLHSDMNHFRTQFSHLATDVKTHLLKK